MKNGADAGEARGEGPRKLGLCVLCGLPAAGKSTFARALSHQLRQERGWAVGVVAYDDVMPDAFLEEASARPLPSQWKLLRQELLKYIEYFLLAVINGCPMAAPPNRTEDSLGFCQIFLDCSLETCVRRNDQRPRALPAETIHLMGRKIEEPNPEKNAWEHRSLTIQSPAFSSEASPELIDLLLTALENPVKYVEDNMEQKETDRIICSTNILHQADQTLRRIVSQTMKEAKDEQVLPYNLKLLAEELNKLKTEFLEDLRQGNKKYLCFQQTIDISDVISSFHYEKGNIVQKYFSK
ncbi:L-seryl-tRNA(Sec) kinase isoform X3 [Rhinolophus ferrumequinum]|uniref:L-seryl-tRNA(Sec) kinase isoform X3 n=1 Tax=Rhinolophus ferrumequinum TaxID=59479 RepID=UPI00140FA614|nr:L-seryl-tRNA(Sec) kinase isoform X3 [Rhinolophus ferrumequinum]